MLLRTAICAQALALATAAAVPDFRLPNTVRPLRYTLDLTIVPDPPQLSGSVEIELETVQTAEYIWLNAKDIEVSSAWISGASGRRAIRAAAAGGEFLSLAGEAPFPAGRWRIGIHYSARLNQKERVGAYRRSDGRDWYVYTAFTAIDARRAFPCFDQPEFKTPWRATLHVPVSATALFNSRMLSETQEAGGMKRVEFAETRPLPSEVVAFAVGPFHLVDDGLAGRNGIPVRIVTPRGRAGEAARALGAARQIVARLEEYTGIPYPWDKLDQLAVLDMPFGAIENPGIIAYRDRILLARPDQDTAERREAMRGTMAHELAHQWFGNLVTQRWWDDVWLSEGFASWLGAKIADLDLPESQRGIAAVESRARIMANDKRPVRLEMRSREDMRQVYSGIVYQKGAAVLRMLEHWLGAEPFRRGLRRYLTAHAMGTATTADLAAALRAETNVDVTPVFNSYLNQPGFPVLRATLDCAANKVLIRQESALSWNTPVCVRGTCSLISGAAAEAPLEACPAWPNDAGAGYFRLRAETLGPVLSSGWALLTAAERLSAAHDAAASSPDAQMTFLPVLLRDRDAHVLAAGLRIALRLIDDPDRRAKVREMLGRGR
jgi:alanyl aminopeptidase